MPGRVLFSRIVAAEVPSAQEFRGPFRASRLWPLGMLVLALVLLSPAPALSQTDPEVRAYLLSINRLYEDLEYESALTQIARARAVTHTPADNATLSLYEGVILADMNRWEESAAAFKKALAVQPEAKLPLKVSPKVAQHFEQVRQSVKQELAARQKPPPPPPPAPPKTDKPVQESKPPPVVVAAKPKPESSVAPSPASGAVAAEPTGVAKQGFMRPQVLIPAVAGGVLIVLGGTSWALSRKELSSLNNNEPTTGDDAHRAASRGRTYQSVGVGLLGAGVAGVGFALGWNAFGSSSKETALRVGTDGTSAFVQGRWP